jgi:hypothetical protein
MRPEGFKVWGTGESSRQTNDSDKGIIFHVLLFPASMVSHQKPYTIVEDWSISHR